MTYWIVVQLPSTTNGEPNQIGYGKVEGYFSPSRMEIYPATGAKIIPDKPKDSK